MMSRERGREQSQARSRDRDDRRRSRFHSPPRKRRRSPIHEWQADPKRRKWSPRSVPSHSPLSSGERTLERSGRHTHHSHSGGRSSAGSRGRYKSDEWTRRSSGRDGGHTSGSGGGHSGSGGGHSGSGSRRPCKWEERERKGGGERKRSVAEDTDIPDDDMLFTASLLNTFYDSGDNEVVRGTEKLTKLHLQFVRILDAFPRNVPLRCSFLSDKDEALPSPEAHEERSVEIRNISESTQGTSLMLDSEAGEEKGNKTGNVSGSRIVDCDGGQEKQEGNRTEGVSKSSSMEIADYGCDQGTQEGRETVGLLASSSIETMDQGFDQREQEGNGTGGVSESSSMETTGNTGCHEGALGGNETGGVSESDSMATLDLSNSKDQEQIEIESADTAEPDISSSEEEEEKREVESRKRLYEHIPVNHPTKVPLFPLGSRYYTFGKGSDVDVESCPEDWFTYRIAVIPSTNFKVSDVSSVVLSDGKKYVFHGFTVVSKHSLDELPECTLDKYGGKYIIKLTEDSTHKNFTLKDALIFEEYLFVKLLEIYDWAEYLNPFRHELFFVPRFCRKVGGTWEVLSMAEVLQSLMKSYQPLQKCGLVGKERIWREGDLLIQHDKVPSCVRMDGISESKGHQVKIKHHCSQLHRKGRNHTSNKAQRKRYKNLQHKKAQGLLTQKEHFELNSLSTECGLSKHGEDYVATLSWEGFHTTGLRSDIPQHVLLLCMISHHILFHDSIKTLQQRLDYHFHNPALLHQALTHPSCTLTSFVVAEDHLRNALSNCGLKMPEFIKSTLSSGGKASRSVKELKKAVMMDKMDVDESQRPQNNEQLEFLGDAVIEYLCSKRLFLNHPEYSVGTLTKERQLLVKNEHLSKLADRLNLGEFVLKNLKTDYTVGSFAHIHSNCVEGVLGAVFLDGGLDEVDRVFARLAFPEKEEHDSWLRNVDHPLQCKYPDGDRHLLDEGSEILKKMVDLEEQRGIKFKHLTLLTKAFVHASCVDTSLTDGSYQRLEFLGDAVLQVLVSKFVYHKFPAHHEGHLSLLRTSLVRNKQLAASICQALGMDKFIITSHTEKVELSVKIMADVVEAFLAALTFDQGLDAAERFLETYLFPRLKDAVCKSQLVDATTRLNQAAAYTCKQQGVKLALPVFRLVKSEGVSDKPTFTMAVFLGKKKLGVGSASSMRDARRKASESALQSGLLRIPPSQREENWTNFASKS